MSRKRYAHSKTQTSLHIIVFNGRSMGSQGHNDFIKKKTKTVQMRRLIIIFAERTGQVVSYAGQRVNYHMNNKHNDSWLFLIV